MTDKQYKRTVKYTIANHKHFLSVLKYNNNTWRTWLHVMGLIETWDIMHDR